MRVDNSINFYSITRTLQNQNHSNQNIIMFGSKFKADTFERVSKRTVKTLNLNNYKKIKHKSSAQSNEQHFSKALSRLKKFSISEYKTLPDNEKNILRCEYNKIKQKDKFGFYEKAESIHDIVSDNIKTHFDKKYGAENYSVIIIGRSLSSIGKVLGYKIGEDNVINIPMSKAARYNYTSTINNIIKNGEMDKYREFLKTQGLEKSQIKNSNKQYIIMDFCYSGNSLKGAKKLLTNNNLLGDKNIHTLDVEECVNDYHIATILDTHLRYCRYKDFSFVEQAYNLLNAQKSIRNPENANKETKLMWFKLLDNQMQKPKQSQKQEPHKNKQSFFNSLRCKLEIGILKPIFTKLVMQLCQ